MDKAPRIRISMVAGRKEDKQALTPEQVEERVAAAVDKYLKGLAALKKELYEGLDTRK